MIRLWAIAVLVAAGILAGAGRHAARALADLRAADRDLATIETHANELLRLRAASKDSSLPPRPSTGLAAQISTTLSRCGLPASMLQSLSPEAQSSPGSSGSIRQRATLNLSGLTLPQVGSFLSAWRESGDYTVSSIELSPTDKTGATPAPGADLPLRAVITLEGLFRDSSAAPPLPSPASPRQAPPAGAKP